MKYSFLFFGLLTLLVACEPTEPDFSYEEGEEYSGGELTTFDFGENAFGHSASHLTYEQENDFVIGNSFFRSNWTTAPATASARDGLGPVFNASSCGGCHPKDGRGRPPLSFGEPLNGLLIRLSGANGKNEPTYGGQLQDKAILGVEPEAKVSIRYTEITGKYADGTTYTLRKPIYEFDEWAYGPIQEGFLFSPRVGSQLPGMGLLEAIDAADIRAYADENDVDGDGISGRVNTVWSETESSYVLGRFGWKANMPNLLEQTAGAFNGDIGITSGVFPKDHTTDNQKELQQLPDGGLPEISDSNLQKVVFYLQTLEVPARRKAEKEEVLNGKKLFSDLNCSACHRPAYKTGQTHPVSVLQNQSIRPYTDLLLHDMGEALADGRPDFEASGTEWRTPPLWGIGLLQTVNGHQFLLHDGRARNLEEAILWHGGEAEYSKKKFTELPAGKRAVLISFLESL